MGEYDSLCLCKSFRLVTSRRIIAQKGTAMEQTIKVGGLIYKIIIKEHFKAYDDDRNLWGYCDYEQQEIYIRESLSKQKKKQVLIHELTHAIFEQAGYKEQDEDMINRVSLVLHQVLLDNPDILLEEFRWKKS